MKKERNLNADLIRCTAVFSVISVHFLKNNGFYSTPVEGWDMLLMCMFRSMFMTCVPLFLLLTGFLMWKKELSVRYYKGIVKTLEIYVLVSIADLIFKYALLGETVTFWSAVRQILAFKAANYSWYIEMYIGLFLLIPFLNLTYHGLKNQKQKQILIGTMLFLTMVPKMVNNFNLSDPSWWLSPGSSTDYDKLVPSFFTAMYPITYYFLGAYLREYQGAKCETDSTCKKTVRGDSKALLSSKKKDGSGSVWEKLLLFLLVTAAFGCYNYYRCDGAKFVWGSNNTWGGENLITAYLLFSLLLDINTARFPKWICRVLTYISEISLGIYLMSWMFDKIIYSEYFLPNVADVHARWKFYPLVAGAVFLGATAGASVIYQIRRGLHGVGAGIWRRMRKKIN